MCVRVGILGSEGDRPPDVSEAHAGFCAIDAKPAPRVTSRCPRGVCASDRYDRERILRSQETPSTGSATMLTAVSATTFPAGSTRLLEARV